MRRKLYATMNNVCNLFVLGFDLCIMKYHVKCNDGAQFEDGEDPELQGGALPVDLGYVNRSATCINYKLRLHCY